MLGNFYIEMIYIKGGIYLATFMYRDERVITLYDKYMNGEIK